MHSSYIYLVYLEYMKNKNQHRKSITKTKSNKYFHYNPFKDGTINENNLNKKLTLNSDQTTDSEPTFNRELTTDSEITVVRFKYQ